MRSTATATTTTTIPSSLSLSLSCNNNNNNGGAQFNLLATAATSSETPACIFSYSSSNSDGNIRLTATTTKTLSSLRRGNIRLAGNLIGNNCSIKQRNAHPYRLPLQQHRIAQRQQLSAPTSPQYCIVNDLLVVVIQPISDLRTLYQAISVVLY